MINVWIIIGLVFALSIICILIGVIVYMLFFKRVTVLVFNSKGQSYAQINVRKKGKTLWYKKKNWEAKEGSYHKFGKKTYYFAQMADENSLTAYILNSNELKADESWLEAMCNSYEKSTRKFKFGLEKYKELISIIVAVLFITVMVLGAVKYTTDLTPVEAEAIKDMSQSLEACSKYVTQGAANQQQITKLLANNQATEVPK